MLTSTHNEVRCVFVRMGERGTVCVLVRIMKLGAYYYAWVSVEKYAY